MIRALLFTIFSFSLLHGVEHKSQIDMSYLGYTDASDEIQFYGTTQLKFKNELFTTDLDLEYLYSSKYHEKRYIQLNEFYLSRSYESYRFALGKRIVYWGELEGYNITDIFNRKNYLLDPFDKSKKLGSWAFTASKYFDDDSIEFGLKFYEEDQKYPKNTSPYYPFSLNYDKHLITENSKSNPSFYVSYLFNTESFIESENRITVWHGYDNKRYFIPVDQTALAQYAYRINKYLFSSNIVYEDIIFKLEASYTDVIDDELMSDYMQWAVGLEKSFFDIVEMDISLYEEYYHYSYRDDNAIKNVDISEIYNDDLFLAMKLNFNDTGSSEIKAGMLYDLGNSEKVFKVEAKTRVKDRFVLHGELLRLLPVTSSLLSSFSDHTRVTVGLTYTF